MVAMFSARFQRRIIVTRNARDRMNERAIADELLLEVIDSGETRYRDALRTSGRSRSSLNGTITCYARSWCWRMP